MIETRITKLLGIKYPIICGCMQWVSRAELVAAVGLLGVEMPVMDRVVWTMALREVKMVT
jgi:hypothetical protein